MIEGNDFLVWRWKWANYKGTIFLSHFCLCFVVVEIPTISCIF
jgi:hypothetical protein